MCSRSCDGNSGFFHNLIFVEVWEFNVNVWIIIGFVCKLFDPCECVFNMEVVAVD